MAVEQSGAEASPAQPDPEAAEAGEEGPARTRKP